jgi:hypothetical protein
MLTASREAMNLRKSSQIPATASLSPPQFDANPFLPVTATCPIFGPQLTSLARRVDDAVATVVGICRTFE